MGFNRVIRMAVSFAAMAAVAFVAGCGSDEEEGEPEVETMRLVIGATTVNINAACVAVPASVTIPAAGAQMTASFLKADGTPETLVTDTEFEIRIEPAGRFTRASAFAGTITGGAAGSAQLSFELFHKVEQHEDFGPCSLTVIVQ
ncbi:MAG: hypothetical protein FJ206_11700 [Gemmatimonadetes bacterium]|nr:hypothetical protein [Gemmatimonadota bacterium]